MDVKKNISEHWVALLLIILLTFSVAQIYYPSFMHISLENFKIFQSTYVGIILFILIFTVFQYVQNQNWSYLLYALYLVCNLLYFIKIFPYLISIFISEEQLQVLFHWKKLYGVKLELTLSILLIASYTLFIQSFVNSKVRFPQIDRWFNMGYVFMGILLVLDYILIFFIGKSITFELVAKFSLAIPGVYVIYLIFKSRTILFDIVLMGSLIIMLGGILTLVVVRMKLNGVYGDEFIINNNKHYFYMLAGSLVEILFFTTAIGYQSLLNEKEKNEAQQKLFDQSNENSQLKIRQLEADIKTLKSQINPHFIFNSLNAIKLLIQENKNKEANLYLVQFSELMRIVMDQATLPKITLEEELKNCQIYLELESLRFDQSFEFEIKQEVNLDLSFIDVPSLVFQPFLENAIWHGLLHKQGQRKVTIEIKQDKDFVICTIEDNGIGRARSATITEEFGLHKKSSIGIKNTKERILVFKQLYKTEIAFQIIDLIDKNKNPLGTQVVFKFLI